MNKRGRIRVGRSIYTKGEGVYFPSYDGFETISVITPRFGGYYDLGPYYLKDDNGCIMENIWQFSKVYTGLVPEVCERYSSGNSKIVWQYYSHQHIYTFPDKSIQVTEDYMKWRSIGMSAPEPVRYPVSYKYKSNVAFCLKYPEPISNKNPPLDYVAARKNIYLETYVTLVRKHPRFAELQEKVNRGENILIVEPDGPHEESLWHYMKTYGVSNTFIQEHSTEATEENISIMIHDTKHSFGHGYCLALALMGYC